MIANYSVQKRIGEGIRVKYSVFHHSISRFSPASNYRGSGELKNKTVVIPGGDSGIGQARPLRLEKKERM